MTPPGESGGHRSPHCYLCCLRCLHNTPSLGKWQVLWFFPSSTLSSYLYSGKPTQDHGSLWKDISLWKRGACVELRGVRGTCRVPAEAVPRYNLPGVWRKHSLFCTSNCSHCGDSPEDEHLDKYNPAQQVWAERNQVFFRLHGRSGSSSFGLRHLRPTATPIPALVDPGLPLNPIWIYCWSPGG